MPSLLVAAPVHTLSAYTGGGYGVPSLLVAAPVHTLSVVVMVYHPF